VIGGGCYGAYYVRQLSRAAAAGAVQWNRVIVVDRDAHCRVSHEAVDAPAHTLTPPEIVVSDWGDFLDGWIPAAETSVPDALVPSPLMPHLFFEYLSRRAVSRWPSRTVARAALAAPVGTPWEQAAPDGTSYISHATWTCPINCIEPDICPHTKDVRSWTMPDTLRAWVEGETGSGDAMRGPFTFHCTHRAFGVGMVDKRPIREADDAIAAAGRAGPVRALVATASHCHGAAVVLAIGPLPVA
jgi:hypothetical protein